MAFVWLLNGADPNHVSKSWDDPPSSTSTLEFIGFPRSAFISVGKYTPKKHFV